MVNVSFAKQKLLVFGNSFLIFLIFLFFCLSVYAISLNEIYPNPTNQTYLDEWIEIEGYKGFSLTNFTICDEIECDKLIEYKKTNSNLALILVNGTNLSKEVNASIYMVEDGRIGNGLNNKADCVYLKANEVLVDYFCWNKTEKSKSWQLLEEWKIEEPTYGEPNKENKEFIIYLPKTVLIKQPFVVLIEAKNKSKLYESKIDILVNGERVSKIYNTESQAWQSTYFYLPAFNLTNKTFLLKLETNKTGIAETKVKLRDKYGNEYEFNFELILVNFLQTNINETKNKTKSCLEFLEWPTEIKSNELIKIKIRIYRGDTRAYAVYAYLEVNGKIKSEKTVFYANEKFKSYELTLPIKIKEIEKDKDSIGFLVLEGLGLRKKIEVKLKSESLSKENKDKKNKKEQNEQNEQSNEQSREKSETYEIFRFSRANLDFEFEYEPLIKANEVLEVKVRIRNKDKKKTKAWIWSYLKKGNRCISCLISKDENAKSIVLNPNETKLVRFKIKAKTNSLIKAILSVKILKENNKIPYSFNFPVYIYLNETESKSIALIYENKLEKPLIYFLLALFIFILILVIFKKEL